MQLLNYIPLQLTCSLVLGILIGYYLNLEPSIMPIALLSLLGLLALFYYYSKNGIGRSAYFMSITFLVFLFIGVGAITFHNDLNRRNHYMNFLSIEHPDKAIIEISAILKSNTYNYKYEANVLNINNEKAHGKILVNLHKDSLNIRLNIDERLYVSSTFLEISQPKNPYQFNYKDYLEKHNIYRQIYISNDDLRLVTGERSSLNGLAHRFRVIVNDRLVNNGFKDDERAIVNALLLGQRQEISKELIENYANAGAIHILAVSGLHVGLMMLLISFILKPLVRLKNGMLIRTAVVILSLWVFAFIAGMSASVIRAVTMFTALSIGRTIGRKNSVYKNLIVSLFFLLLFNPYYLFEVGFQLSYLAVFSIVWIQPMLYKCWKPSWKLSDYFWQLFTVSVAAQLGVLPLSLYYFHQFPGLFFITNLVIIPVLGMILGLGIVVIVLSLLSIVPPFIASFYQEIISSMNHLISWIAKQETFLFKEISFSLMLVVSSYIFIVFCFRWINKRSRINLHYVLFTLIILQGTFIYEKYKSRANNEFVIFNKNKATAFVITKKGKAQLYTSDSFGAQSTIFKAYRIGSKAKDFKLIDSIQNVFTINNMKLLVIDSVGLFKLSGFKPDYILLRESPKINLERLIDELNPKFIIADASNYKSYVNNWQKTSFNKGVNFHATVNNGAYIEKW